MKDVLLILTGLLIGEFINAQTISAFFNQNATQLSYLRAQIAALKGYAQVLETGYTITRNGLQTILTIKQGEFGLHAGYFSSLNEINPAVGSDSRVMDIYLYNDAIQAVADALESFGQEQPPWSSLLTTIVTYVRAAADQDEELLDEVLEEGELRLKDAERLRLIAWLFDNSRMRYGYAMGLLNYLKARNQ
jgi:hypothetical protein